MANWETDWERRKRLERERDERSNSLWGHALWTAGAITIAAVTYSALKNNDFELVIGHIKNAFVEEQELPPREMPQQARQPLSYREAEASNIQRDQGEITSPPHQPQYVAPRRSVQEEYELASRIMESTRNEMQQQRAADAVIRNRYGVFQDQLSFDQWWLSSYEKECTRYDSSSFEYRDCRGELKERSMHECRERTLRFGRLQSLERDRVRAENEAQCYAANYYRIVE